MKTLVVTSVFPPAHGGSGRWMWEIYSRQPHGQYVLAAGEVEGDRDFDAAHDVRVDRLPLSLSDWSTRSMTGLRGYWRMYRQLGRIVRRERVGMLHCGHMLPDGWATWLLSRRYRIPYVCYVHGEEWNFAGGSRELEWMCRRVLGGARILVANSDNTRRILLEEWRVPAERVRVLNPGVNTARFVPRPRDMEFRDRIGWGDRPVVLTVGRLQERKGQDVGIKAIDLVRRTVPDVLYAIVGDGEDRTRLVNLVREFGLENHVRLHGALGEDDVLQCHQQCDVFALPNRQVGRDIEGFGIVLLESQACGKPVLAGDSGGTRETMTVGESGEIVDCSQPDMIAKSIVRLLADSERRATMGRAAREWVESTFDWNVLAEKARTLFEERLGGEGSVRSVTVPAGVGQL